MRRGLVNRPEDWRWSSARDWQSVPNGLASHREDYGNDKNKLFKMLNLLNSNEQVKTQKNIAKNGKVLKMFINFHFV